VERAVGVDLSPAMVARVPRAGYVIIAARKRPVNVAQASLS
jgi:hypothetical protein